MAVDAPRSAGVYTVTVSYPGTESYEALSFTRTITIAKRAVSIVLVDVIADFDGQEHGVSAEVFAFDGTSLGMATVSYTGGPPGRRRSTAAPTRRRPALRERTTTRRPRRRPRCGSTGWPRR